MQCSARTEQGLNNRHRERERVPGRIELEGGTRTERPPQPSPSGERRKIGKRLVWLGQGISSCALDQRGELEWGDKEKGERRGGECRDRAACVCK